METSSPARAVRSAHTLAIAAVVVSFLLILMGALVTNNEAGDSIPDWPLAYGRVLPLGHLQGGAVYEFSHRAVAGAVAVLTVALAVTVIAGGSVRAATGLAIAALAGLVIQAALGGLRVRLGETYSHGLAALHAFAAQLFLALLSALAALLAPPRGGLSRGAAASASLKASGALAAVTAGAILVQAFLGAAFRHRVLAVLPHVAVALLVAAAVAMTFTSVRRALGPDAGEAGRRIVRAARLAFWMLGLQILLGIAVYLLMVRVAPEARPAAAVVAAAAAHLGLGAALLADMVVLCLRALRAS